MNIYAGGAFAITFLNMLFWFFSFNQKSLSLTARAYFWWSFYISLWALGYGVTLSGIFDYKTTLVWNKFCQAMAVMIGPFFFKFGLCVAERFSDYKRIYKAYLIFAVVNAILLFFTPYYVKGLWHFDVACYHPLGGPLYIIFTLFFYWCTVHSFLVAACKYRTSTGRQRKQIQFFLLGTGIAYSGGGTLFLQAFKVPLPAYGVYLVLAYVIVIGFAVHKYQFMDISVLLRKTIVFTGLLGMVFGIFTFATVFVQKILSAYFKTSETWASVISLSLIVFGYDPIRNLLVNLTDKYLFQRKYDYQKLLRDASRGMSRIESLDHLLRLVVHFVTMKMRVRNAGVITRQNASDVFTLYNQRGYAKNFFDYRMNDSSPLIQYLATEKEALDIERVKELIEAESERKTRQSGKKKEYPYREIKAQMEELEAVCCVPSFLGHALRNVLILGEKKSGDFYTEDDLNVLFTLAQESAIAIENARLYDEAVTKTHELERINEQLEYSKSLLMRALKETEIANKQLQDTQAQLIHEQKMATLGRLAASVGHEVNNPLTILSMNVSRAILKYRKNPETKLADVLELFDKMEQNIGRIKAVVNTLTGLLKRSEKGKFEPLSLKLILEETLPLVQFQTYLDNLSGTEVEFDIPGHLPLIRGDLERLQEVFLNLFINAYHAMEGKRNRKIFVSAIADPNNPRQVAVYFQDNGSGMSDEVLKKAFTYGFTTKPPGRGSGMGLYMCKYIIELHGGEMHVQSKLGEGTTFTLTLPVSEETGMSGIGQEGAGRI